jgi:hypothetical protein
MLFFEVAYLSCMALPFQKTITDLNKAILKTFSHFVMLIKYIIYTNN